MNFSSSLDRRWMNFPFFFLFFLSACEQITRWCFEGWRNLNSLLPAGGSLCVAEGSSVLSVWLNGQTDAMCVGATADSERK